MKKAFHDTLWTERSAATAGLASSQNIVFIHETIINCRQRLKTPTHKPIACLFANDTGSWMKEAISIPNTAHTRIAQHQTSEWGTNELRHFLFLPSHSLLPVPYCIACRRLDHLFCCSVQFFLSFRLSPDAVDDACGTKQKVDVLAMQIFGGKIVSSRLSSRNALWRWAWEWNVFNKLRPRHNESSLWPSNVE